MSVVLIRNKVSMSTVKAHVESKIRSLYKQFLYLLEDMSNSHNASFDGLERALPDHMQEIAQADWFNEEKYNHLRKRVLDMGNETVRSLDSILTVLDAEIVLKVKGNEAKGSIHI